jgi:uncharacterized membrane protein
MKRSTILIVSLAVVSFVLAFYFYPLLPDRVASHWDFLGQANGYAGKIFGLFLIPSMIALFNILFIFIPDLDPEKKNIDQFRDAFNWFIVAFDVFMLYLYVLTIFWNTGHHFNMTAALMPAFAFLFYVVGIMVEKAKRNYTIGIRLPWTMANDVVWDKTHRLGGKLFKLTAVIALLGAFFPGYAFWLLFIPSIASIIILAVYSYLVFREIGKKEGK